MRAKGSDIMLEEYLIEYCSPTLASLKPANYIRVKSAAYPHSLNGQYVRKPGDFNYLHT